MPGFVGLPELIFLAIIVLVFVGPKKLPEMGRSLGHGLREFKSSVSGESKTPDHAEISELFVEPAANNNLATSAVQEPVKDDVLTATKK